MSIFIFPRNEKEIENKVKIDKLELYIFDTYTKAL